MSNPTKEQQTAIDTSGKNIIVSAGAGSGKTFVLKERVLKMISNDTTVDKLIILTFTNNAAGEMKERIRKIINEHPEVSNQASLLDSAYITTFDSFAGSIVKKYNYLLNIDKNFTIIDSNIVNTELTNIIEDIFNRNYDNMSDSFKTLIDNYCFKTDTDLKLSIINIYRKLLNILDRNAFLDDYINTFFSKDKIKELIDLYNDNVFNKLGNLLQNYNDLLDHVINDSALTKLQEKINVLESASTRDEILTGVAMTTPRNGKNPVYDEDADEYKTNISALEKEIKELCKYTDQELINQYKSTEVAVSELINILKELDKRILEFKDKHNSYEFSDIAFKAIDLVKNYPDVRNEIRDNTYEIMIDEYQDTNDIQEEFISYIQKNNVYMVGDVKQSIYRFRNANPYIFKSKYDNYKDGKLGIKIDLTSNFRSREEVISNLNDMFSTIMFDDIGGAKYQEEHQMKHGNKNYNEHLMDNYDYNMQILNYKMPEDKLYEQAEIEAFIIANDIKNKLKNNIKVMDGDNNFVDAKYSDFCILIDKSKNFELIKKILEFNNIPTSIYKDISIKEDDEVFILKNLITLIIHIKNNTLDTSFKHSYMSIGRSYIYKISDNELYNIYKNNTYRETSLYNKLVNISNQIDGLSNKEILIKLIEEFDIINKLINVGDVEERSKKLEYFINQADGLNKFGLDIYSLEKYFDSIIESDSDFNMAGKNASGNAVKIMTIHGSKGLEFPFVYMPLLNSDFRGTRKDKFSISNKYGFLLDYNENGLLDKTFVNSLYNEDELKENVSERLRLLYVAITRAREQFILINSFNDNINPKNRINSNDLLNCKSYTDILSMLKNKYSKYTTNIDISKLNLTKDYNSIKESNYNNLIDKSNTIINIKELNIPFKVLESNHFSKPLSKVMDKSFKELLDYGTFMHYVFEVFDFKNGDPYKLDLTDEERNALMNFFKHDETKEIKDAIIYKEHEIRFVKDNQILHGFIDLLLEYPDHFDIIDYKLSNIQSSEYEKQLNGYRKYIESTYNKPCNMYLYSIKKDIFKKIDKIDE